VTLYVTLTTSPYLVPAVKATRMHLAALPAARFSARRNSPGARSGHQPHPPPRSPHSGTAAELTLVNEALATTRPEATGTAPPADHPRHRQDFRLAIPTDTVEAVHISRRGRHRLALQTYQIGNFV
jgi:hypothetical protein